MSECQLFDGPFNNRGYGNVSLGGKTIGAHRLAWALHNGADPAGKVVMHTCDNPPCVNPEHLVLGTRAENRSDMMSKGRHGHGECHWNSKLTALDVQEIRKLVADGSKQQYVAEKFQISQASVSHICHMKNWKRKP